MDKKIILIPNQLPKFVGEWAVGEVLQMAQGLAGWVEQLKINEPTENKTDGNINDLSS